MKILISSCILGNSVRWNGTSKLDKDIAHWARENNYELVPICPEHELFGTPRKPIRLRQVAEHVIASMGSDDVALPLRSKCDEIANRHKDVVGFIGISNSPSCGLAVGVKGRGSTMKAFMHQALDCPTTEINSMRSEANRELFLKRIKKYVKKT